MIIDIASFRSGKCCICNVLQRGMSVIEEKMKMKKSIFLKKGARDENADIVCHFMPSMH